MKLPRIAWYWHIVIFIVVIGVMSAVSIWFGLGHSVHSMADWAA